MSIFINTTKAVKIEKRKDTTLEYLRNEIIFKKDSLVSYIAIILRGEALAIKNNTIIKKLEKNAVIGLSLIFSSYPFYDYTYISSSNTTLKLIYKDQLLENKLNQKLLAYLSNYAINLERHNRLLQLDKKSRVREYLYYEFEEQKTNSFYIKYSKAELASYLNLTLKELTAILTDLKANNIIANQNKLYILLDINYFK